MPKMPTIKNFKLHNVGSFGNLIEILDMMLPTWSKLILCILHMLDKDKNTMNKKWQALIKSLCLSTRDILFPFEKNLKGWNPQLKIPKVDTKYSIMTRSQ
jgi:hypothetical protein